MVQLTHRLIRSQDPLPWSHYPPSYVRQGLLLLRIQRWKLVGHDGYYGRDI